MSQLDPRVDELFWNRPELSAARTLSRGQIVVLVSLLLASLVIALQSLPLLLTLVIALSTVLYLATLAYRLLLLRVALRSPADIHVSDEQARAIPDEQLPIYTILVPAFRETSVIPRTVAALEALAYPADLLDVKLLLEEDDWETIAAARAIDSRLEPEIVIVPPGSPRTKPKACNYGLLTARGKYVTIYDVEDRPEPLQLRRVVAAFHRTPPLLACLQAKLTYHNIHQNLITRWFTAEYETWFGLLLPALARIGGPIPLGGTSMHIPRRVLEAIGGWDPHNVTEDADLGIRLQRFGYQVAVLDSTTLEEANSDFVNWIRQRSRWYKGYLQTWLVHMRHPVRAWEDLGDRGFIGLNLLLGAVPLVAILNPVFWFLTALWFLVQPPSLASLLPSPIYYPALLSMLVGNFIAIYIGVIAVRVRGRSDLLGAVLLSPIYWAMMSIAAIRAFAQLLIAPSFWEKSVHGLAPSPTVEVVAEHAGH